MVKTRVMRLSLAFVALLSTTGCNPEFAMGWRDATPPAGYVLASDEGSTNMPIARYKGTGRQGMKIHSFDNPKGGTLAYWSADLQQKLSERGYRLENTQPIQSSNNIPGQRLDFMYKPMGQVEQEAVETTYFTAILFVTDRYRSVVQFAGPADSAANTRAQIPEIIARLEVGGCNRRNSICKTPAPAATASTP